MDYSRFHQTVKGIYDTKKFKNSHPIPMSLSGFSWLFLCYYQGSKRRKDECKKRLASKQKYLPHGFNCLLKWPIPKNH